MKYADLQVLSHALTSLKQNRKVWLCTVIETWGSSPRPTGSLMSCTDKGHIEGSLSGGCVEDDLIDKLLSASLASDRPEVMDYGISKESAERFGLPCGGQLTILIEPLQPSPELIEDLVLMVEQLQRRRCVRRQLDISTGEFSISISDEFQQLNYHQNSLSQSYGPSFMLFIIGAVQVAKYLAEFALALDYKVVVCDPRPEQLAQWQVDNVQLVQAMPDDAVKQYVTDPQCAIIALTHDPRIDDMGLMEALPNSQASYIGAMGSKNTTDKRRLRLGELGLNEQDVARLHAPIGLNIGSKTPAEIAIAILAELTQIRRNA